MRVGLLIPTYRRYDLLAELLRSVRAQPRQPDEILIIDNGGQLQDRWPNVAVIDPGRNLGVAASWNKAFDTYWDLAIVANDDLIADGDFVGAFEEAAMATPEIAVWMAMGFTLFAVRPKLAESKVGRFDENFWPAYAEDSDYYRRIQLADAPSRNLPMPFVRHPEPGRTLASIEGEERSWFMSLIQLNRRYYLQKWGGLLGHETRSDPDQDVVQARCDEVKSLQARTPR